MDITAIKRNVARNSLQRYRTTGGQRCIKLVILWGFLGHTAQHEGSESPDQRSNLCPLQRKRRVLTTGPPGKSLVILVSVTLLILFRTPPPPFCLTGGRFMELHVSNDRTPGT